MGEDELPKHHSIYNINCLETELTRYVSLDLSLPKISEKIMVQV